MLFKFSHFRTLFFLGHSLFYLTGCHAVEILKRGDDDGKPLRETPSLRTVPDRPPQTGSPERTVLEKELQSDYEQTASELKEDVF